MSSIKYHNTAKVNRNSNRFIKHNTQTSPNTTCTRLDHINSGQVSRSCLACTTNSVSKSD